MTSEGVNDNSERLSLLLSQAPSIDDLEDTQRGVAENPLSSLFSANDIEMLQALPQGQVLEILGRVLRGEDYRQALRSTAPEVVERYVDIVASQYDHVEVLCKEEINDGETTSLGGNVKFFDGQFRSIAEHTPLRLTHTEREYLRLVEGALKVSEYTDKVDILAGSRTQRIAREVKQTCKVLSGLIVAHDYAEGKRLMTDNDYGLHTDVFQTMFEIMRRYKIMNPDLLRDAYGKCIYMLMDSRKPEIKELLGFDLVRPVVTVGKAIELHGIERIYDDPRLKIATMEIFSKFRTRQEISADIKRKEQAIRELSDEYANWVPPSSRSGLTNLRLKAVHLFWGSGDEEQTDEVELTTKDRLSKEAMEQILYSLCDHHSHIRACVYPIDRMLVLLESHFSSTGPTNEYDWLNIKSGSDGARLSHGHTKQYKYVEQTLTFWRYILLKFHLLWTSAEDDLLSEDAHYALRDTGQGLNRIQRAPTVSHVVQIILNMVKNKMGYWIGSDAVHLGDHNVPNALMFIDKYTQVPRIIQPLENVLDKIPTIFQGPMGRELENTFGPPDHIRTLILGDFFRHAFDGSGADNFFDAGSCIDGRLTSAWNWCSNIHKKSYYPVFQLAGFTGFDGEF
eukprot:GHVH01016751.1.p1 GENE.GHVH01016751.1~~GHVH01016751.1.p1  ORF type:complete len:622 (-),score=77.50 GHVH01016751.1:238-2103(-)